MRWFNYLQVSQLSSLSANCLFRMPWTDLKWNSNSPFVPRAFLTTKEVLVLLSPDTSPGLTSQSLLLPKSPSSTRSLPSPHPPARSHPHTQWKGMPDLPSRFSQLSQKPACGECALFLGTWNPTVSNNSDLGHCIPESASDLTITFWSPEKHWLVEGAGPSHGLTRVSLRPRSLQILPRWFRSHLTKEKYLL